MRPLLAAALLLFAPATAFATLIEAEPANDDFTTTEVVSYAGGALAEVGLYGLTPNDYDLIRLANVPAGGVVSAMTTPVGVAFTSPDTILGISDANTTLLAANDDAGDGFGSAVRTSSPSNGDLFLGATGLLDPQGDHSQIGSYVLTVSILDSMALPLTGVAHQQGFTSSSGLNALSPGGVLIIPIDGVQAGDIISAMSTPWATGLTQPDTIIAFLDPNGAVLAINDDAGGVGSALRTIATTSGSFSLVVSGTGDTGLSGQHFQSGDVGLTVSIVTVSEPWLPLLLAATPAILSLRRMRHACKN